MCVHVSHSAPLCGSLHWGGGWHDIHHWRSAYWHHCPDRDGVDTGYLINKIGPAEKLVSSDLQYLQWTYTILQFHPKLCLSPFLKWCSPVIMCNLRCCDTTSSCQRSKCFCLMRNTCHGNQPSFWRAMSADVTVVRNKSHGNQRETILM